MIQLSERHWDPEGLYAQYDLREYKHWVVALSTRQHTLGSCIIFYKFPGVWRFSELTPAPACELITVHRDLEELIQDEFGATHFNYCQYGNKLKVLHEHVIPRYQARRERFGKVWIDPTPESLPVWKKTDEDEDTLIKIRIALSLP